MRRAILLALQGEGNVSPNPLVGAVIVKNGKIIGEGFHENFGNPHAEVMAVVNASENVNGATLYCTLEPCCHADKKTPPCTKRIIAEGFKRVVIGCIDPNPEVNGKGIMELEAAGIKVHTGILEDDCYFLIEPYAYFIQHNFPYIAIKVAQTLDGQIATSSGDSKWITDDKARKIAHELRAKYDAVLIGTKTCLVDNPALTVRHVRGRDPFRIIIDDRLQIPLEYKIFDNDDPEKTIILTGENSTGSKYKDIIKKGVNIISVPRKGSGLLDIESALKEVSRKFLISSILIEGGSFLITEMIKSELVVKFYWFVAPKFTGKGTPSIGDLSIDKISDAIELKVEKIENIDSQILVTGNFLFNN